MNKHKIRDSLGRVRPSLSRHEFSRALNLAISAFRELGGQQAPLDLRTDFRDAITDLASDPDFKKFHEKPFGYQAGTERDMLAILVAMQKELTGQAVVENYEETLQRKLKLDHCIKEGKAMLAEGKASEADTRFVEAGTYITDESAAFIVMARAMMDADEYVRALGHLRAGLKVAPQNQDLRRLAEECLQLRTQQGKK
ncbi:MAG: hypothetical protein LBB60_12200 [Desulfovibrio sp.]|jgi:hypothetical protein|nr:hypothetical protein [Desulfovibrio sp.]